MITLYTWATPNGKKISILLEELGLPFKAVPIDIGKGDQFAPDFLKISPNNKIPALVDSDGPDGKPISLFESGAIMLYLGDGLVIAPVLVVWNVDNLARAPRLHLPRATREREEVGKVRRYVGSVLDG